MHSARCQLFFTVLYCSTSCISQIYPTISTVSIVSIINYGQHLAINRISTKKTTDTHVIRQCINTSFAIRTGIPSAFSASNYQYTELDKVPHRATEPPI